MGLQRVRYDWAAFPLTLTLERLHTVWFYWHEILEKIKLLRYRIDDRLPGVKDSGRQCYWRNSTGSFQGNGIFWYPDHIGILSEAICVKRDFPGDDSGKESTCQCRRQRRPGFDPWVGKIPRKGNGNPVQCSCLENPMDRGAWRATVHRVAKTQTQLKQF